jgi:hypothetical protein
VFCPSCKCEYRAGATLCSDCGVPLVDSLDPGAPSPPDGGELVLVWAGNDPQEWTETKEALTKAKIPFSEQESSAYFIFRSMRPKSELFVPKKYVERARKVLLDLGSRVDPAELTAEEIKSLELPESDGAYPDGHASIPSDLPEDWDDQEPASEVWSGGDEDFANTLLACFREISIPSRKFSKDGEWRLVVRPEQEARAKEIVREVVEASPPQ